MNDPLAPVLAAAPPIPDGPYLVAVSGGPDSAVAAALVATLPGSVRLVHLDHGTEYSPALGAAAAKLAAHLGLPLDVVPLEIGPGSWETAARRARRAVLEEMAGAEAVIVTGHHRDDLAETMVGHLLRGAGARGLASLCHRAGPYWRPLLGLGRTVLRTVADELGLPYVDDPANLDRRHRRNLIRHDVMPILEGINPRASEALARAASHLGADDALLDELAGRVPVRTEGGAHLVPIPVLATVPGPLAARVLARLVRSARPPYGPSAAEMDRLLAVALGRVGRTELGGGLVAEREGPHLALYRPADAAAVPEPVSLPVPGEVRFGEYAVMAVPTGRRLRRPGGLLLDAEVVGADLVVRAVESGERLALDRGSKKVGEVLAEAGVARRRRAGWPMIEAHGKIAAVVGIRAAAWARSRPATLRHVLVGSGGRVC